MAHIIVSKPFKFAHAGIQVEEFEPGPVAIETTDECADLAIAEDWATAPVQASAPADAESAVPETVAAAAAPETRDAVDLPAADRPARLRRG
jgi:hypothetical protein